MKIKRIIAADMRGAMRQVRQIFGDDAVILSNRNCPEGVEVIAAMDFDEQAIRLAAAQQTPHRVAGPTARAEARPKPKSEPAAAAAPAAPTASASSQPENGMTTADMLKARAEKQSQLAEAQPPAAEVPRRDTPETEAEPAAAADDRGSEDSMAFADALAQFQGTGAPATDPAEEQNVDNRDQVSSAPTGSVSMQAAAKEPDWSWVVDQSEQEASRLSGLQEEVGMLRELFERQLAVLEWHRYAREHPMELETGERLQALGLPQKLARSLAADAVKEQPDRALPAALRDLGQKMQIADQDLVDRGGIYALVGPTGVGKTTTLAKLAARAVLKYGRESVALITTDRFRIGAQEQLRNYARILNVPLHVARDEHHLGELLGAVGDRRLVLVDTAGMSQRDFRMMTMLEKMPQIDSRLNMVLVLSANAQYVSQVDIIRRFGVLPLSGMVLTKLDETVLLGGALAALVTGGVPLYCAGVGQRVPEDLWRPSSADLIRQAIELGQADMTKSRDEATDDQPVEQAS